MGEGIELLRRKRGNQRVTFGEVADHLVDYVRRHPAEAAVVEQLARFLAHVEDADHDHEPGPADGTLHRAQPVPEEPTPQQ